MFDRHFLLKIVEKIDNKIKPDNMYGACTEYSVSTSLIPIVLLYFSTYNSITYLGGVVGTEDSKIGLYTNKHP